jgi:hypothetical protein
MLNAPQRHERHQLVSIVPNPFKLISYSICSGKPCFNTDIVTHRLTEHDHVQDSTIAKLQRIRTFGAFKLCDFKGLISKEDMAIYEAYKPRIPSWYPLTMDIFVKFLHAVSFLKLCTCHFHIMKWIMRFLHLNYCRTETMRCCIRRCLLELLRDCARE